MPVTIKPIGTFTESQIESIMSRISPEPMSGCHLWLGVCRCGYALAVLNGKQWRVSRIVYWLFYGVDPGALLVLHKCDMPLCVNPRHLFLGTNDDNMQDKVRKGRQWHPPGGANNCRSTFTEDEIREMRGLRSEGGLTYTAISKLYDTSRSQAWMICHRKSYKEVK